MSREVPLFEVSWEVCNKVGGIHTVMSTKAKTLVERLGDDYVCVGPWLLNNPESDRAFEESPGFEAFAESCRALGVPVRVGRWRIPSSPRVVLVEFSGLFESKDDILAKLWETYGVDSITSGWDYHEPVMFGHAAALVIERWYEEFLAPRRQVAVAQFHEWMTGSGLLELKRNQPAIGTVFTTHATMLGRSLSSTGVQPEAGLAGDTPGEAAERMGVRAKHSMEHVCAREADVFTTVSELTANEAELFFARRPDPVLPNGIDLDVIDELKAGVERDAARAALGDLAHRFLGEPVDDALLLMISGRYEFHNKGIDVLLEAMAKLEERPGRPLVLFLTVPAGQSGICRSVQERMNAELDSIEGPLGISTHNLNDRDGDPIQQAAARLGLDNAAGSRVKVIQIPIYLSHIDGLLDMSYEAVLGAADLTCFPSYYEPWGYTPEESLAVGVPTVTTDLAGFGRWALTERIGPEDGLFVLLREHEVDEDATALELAELIDTFSAERFGDESLYEICRTTALRTAWADLIANYDAAFASAAARAGERAKASPPSPMRPVTSLPSAEGEASPGPRLFPFEVAATLPERLRGLERLAANFYWCWDPEGAELFSDLAPAAWKASEHNPVHMLRMAVHRQLEERAEDATFLAKLDRVVARFDAYLAAGTRELVDPSDDAAIVTDKKPVAYFCAEFGVHESLPIYSGGLGVLAGDHLKAASDLALPLVGVGLFYRKGYLRQQVTEAGDQVALDHVNEPRNLAIEPVLDEDGQQVEVSVEMPSSRMWLRAWKARVGRVPLYLLDADYDKNRSEDRAVTAELYGGDSETRLRQEIALGRGGVRLLNRLGLEPSAWHINEGHAAFMTLERVGTLVRERALTFDEATELVAATTAFTTHTPVPAGHDRFGEDLIRRYFSDVPGWMGVSWERFIELGRAEGEREEFNMTLLALNFAGFVNGVSRLHGSVSQELLRAFWPGLLVGEVPVTSITNGIHLASWTNPALAALMGTGTRPITGADFEERAYEVDDRALWEVRRTARAEFLAAVRRKLELSFVSRHDSPTLLQRMLDGLDEDALLVGFARRFAPYKRASLLFEDLERLRSLFEVEGRPLRVFFAGKAHPRDELGKDVLREVVARTRSDEFVGKVFFLEDYDMDLARRMVQGVDVWLNTPIRGLEASGTSGMKASANGVLNVSVSDGWWVEGYDGHNGWVVGSGRNYEDQALQNELDSANLCRLFEEEVMPSFFERDGNSLPPSWLERVRRNLATIPHVFDTARMVSEYRDLAYRNAARRTRELAAGSYAGLRARAAERARLRKGFGAVRVAGAHVSELSGLKVGDRIQASVEVELGELRADDVQVELVVGRGDPKTEPAEVQIVRLKATERTEGGALRFEGAQSLERAGGFSYGIRVRPASMDDEPGPPERRVVWA